MGFDERATQSLGPHPRRTGAVVALRITRDGYEHELRPAARRWILGSGDGCDVVIDDRYVSQMHCVIERRAGGGLFIRDHRSRNGTCVDGNRVEAAELRVGSYLTVGRTTLVAVSAPGAEQPAALEMVRGRDPALRATLDQALRAAQGDCNVLVVGETGTGKELVARIVHEGSRRSVGPFVAVNCGAIPRELIASELFGHDKGAFTGAHADRDGYFVEAANGTLFLDEVGELPLEMQPHLLRALETRRVRRVGGMADRAVDVRFVAATNQLDGLGQPGSRMRADLYHRLATVVLMLPPLRERMGDLPELVEAMLAELAPTHGLKRISDDGWRALTSHCWPGNIRELRGAIARGVTLGGDELGPADLFGLAPVAMHATRTPVDAGSERLVPYQAMLRGAMEQALVQHGTIRAAAHHLGMAKSTFADKAKAWGLTPRRRLRLGLKKAS